MIKTDLNSKVGRKMSAVKQGVKHSLAFSIE